MVEIKSGVELDRAVAEACGVKGWIESLRNEVTGYESPERFVLASTVETVFWEPSTDLNDAFFAAEKVFDCRLPVTTGVAHFDRDRRRWIVERVTDDEGNATRYRCALEVYNEEDYYQWFWQEEVESFEDTPALAICAAILELAKGNDCE